jgi:L-ribulose-5-phosphate 3-epimerase
MDLSINSRYLIKQRGSSILRSDQECFKLCRNAGFSFIDYHITGSQKIDNIVFHDDWQNNAKILHEYAETIGLKIDQTHAPYIFNTNQREFYREIMRRAFEVSGIFGAKTIVIHADTYAKGEKTFDPDEAINVIYDFYAPYIEIARKFNFTVAIENLFETSLDGSRDRFTSNIDEQLDIIKKFNDPFVKACWDFGHGQMVYGDNQLKQLNRIGSLLCATHVSDNNFGMDLHQNPFFGSADWERIMSFLKECHYSGRFTYELIYGILPDALIEPYLKLFYDTGIYLLSLS